MFERFYELAPTLIHSFADIANWMFTHDVQIFEYTFTPFGLMFGGGLVLYVTYTLVKYVADIFG